MRKRKLSLLDRLISEADSVMRTITDRGHSAGRPSPAEGHLDTELSEGGFAELVVLPRAPLAGQCLRDFGLRKTYMVEPIVLLTGAERQPADFSDMPLSVGDVIVVHGNWEHIRRIAQDRSFNVLTPIEGEETDPSKGIAATLCYLSPYGVFGRPLTRTCADRKLGNGSSVWFHCEAGRARRRQQGHAYRRRARARTSPAPGCHPPRTSDRNP